MGGVCSWGGEVVAALTLLEARVGKKIAEVPVCEDHLLIGKGQFLSIAVYGAWNNRREEVGCLADAGVEPGCINVRGIVKDML